MRERPNPDLGRSERALLFTDGRFVLSDTDALGARDPIGLTSQVKHMREGMEAALGGMRAVGLILIVVDDEERKGAVNRILRALDPEKYADA